MFTYLTPTEIKSIVPSININISDTMIEEATFLIQETLICDSIGREWYEEFNTQISGGTLTEDNTYIFNNYIQYLLSYGVWQYLTITLSYQLNEAGLRIKSSDHSQLAESNDLSYYRSYIQNLIDNKRKMMYDYIRLNSGKYPLYYSSKYGDEPKSIYNFKIGKVQKSYPKNIMGLDDGPIN